MAGRQTQEYQLGNLPRHIPGLGNWFPGISQESVRFLIVLFADPRKIAFWTFRIDSSLFTSLWPRVQTLGSEVWAPRSFQATRIQTLGSEVWALRNFQATRVDTLGVDTLGSEVSASSGFQATRVQTLGSEEGLGFRCRGLGFRV